MKYISQIFNIALRELDILRRNRIYGFCMIVFPLLLVVFFTTMLDDGVAIDLPVGVVDQDNSATSRGLIRNLDAMQSSRVVYRFANVTEARNAMQEGKVYAYLLIPEGTVGQATLSAKGASKEQIRAAMQPVTVDAHMIANPEGSYNYSLTTVFVPGILMLFMALLSAYAVGMEMKFDTGKEWLAMADGNIVVAIVGKYLVHALVFLLVIFLYQWYIFDVLHFPHLGGVWSIVRLTLLQVSAGLGFGIFAFGLMPSLRMSMSISSLWSVLSISMCGSAFPIAGMDAPLQAMSWLFPLRHYWMIYQAMPWFVLSKVKNAMLNYVYIP